MLHLLFKHAVLASNCDEIPICAHASCNQRNNIAQPLIMVFHVNKLEGTLCQHSLLPMMHSVKRGLQAQSLRA
jgi:hypothetical protein